MKLPIAILDFEASSLSLESYPIEVGLAICPSVGDKVEAWSSLICPTAAWLARNDWDASSEAIHGIKRTALSGAATPSCVIKALNDRLASIGHAWCDGGRYDQLWLSNLAKAASVKPKFHLWDISGLFALDRGLRNLFANKMAASEPPHRAGPDAARICTALLEAKAATTKQFEL